MKKKHGYLTAVFAVTLLLNSACNDDDPNRTVIPLEGDVYLGVDVNNDGLERSVSIYAVTETVYHCLGFTIDMDTRVRNGELKMCCNEVFVEGICPDALGTAFFTWELGNAGPGEYPIEVQIGKEKSVGTLIMEEDSGYLKFDELNRIQLQ